MLTPADARLVMLARSIITESLLFLGRSSEALRSFVATRPIYEQLGGRRTRLKVTYLEALLLAALGCARESEKAFRNVIDGYIEEELYKDAFLSLLTFFETLFNGTRSARRNRSTRKPPSCYPRPAPAPMNR